MKKTKIDKPISFMKIELNLVKFNKVVLLRGKKAVIKQMKKDLDGLIAFVS